MISDSYDSFESNSSLDEDFDESEKPKKTSKKKPQPKKTPPSTSRAKSVQRPKSRAKSKSKKIISKEQSEDETTNKENESQNTMEVESETEKTEKIKKTKSKSRARNTSTKSKSKANTKSKSKNNNSKQKKDKKKKEEYEENKKDEEDDDDEIIKAKDFDEEEENNPYELDSFDQDKEINEIYAQKENKLECTAVEEIIDPNYFIEALIVYDKFKLAKIPDTNPMDIFNKFFTNEFFKYICDQTNNYAYENNLNKDKSITTEDIKNYFFILIYVSVIKLPQIDMLWTKSEFYSTIVPKVMTLYKFKKITQYFHVGAVGGADPMSKLNLIISYFNEKWKENYYYGQFSTIDECMAAFKGKTRFRQYIKSKHKKRGIKFFAQSNSLTGYLYSVIPYTGKEMEYDRTIGCGPSVLKTFINETIEGYRKNGQDEIDIHFTFDNYFSSVDIFDYFNKLDMYFTCTINAKRNCFPDNVKTAKCAKGAVRSFIVGDNEYRYLLYNQKGKIAYLASNAFTAYNTTYVNKMRKKKIKPEIVYIYNVTKAGVDKIDSTTNQYKSQRRTKKWWKAAFFYLFDVTLYNASVVYFENTEKEENSKVLFFRRRLYEMHFSNYLRTKEVNQTSKYHLPKRTEQFRECDECKKNKDSRKQHVNRTRYICTGCNAKLCVDCFVPFHKY